MKLVERDADLAALTACADRALTGEGVLVVVVGESGAGKTAFVEHFLAQRAGRVRTLSAVCDPLTTPRPLGPILDIAHAVGEQSLRMLGDAEHAVDIFDALFAELGSSPTVLVIDDLQWADQGTIDMLRFVLRRIHRCPLLVIGIAREDEVHPAHPMRTLARRRRSVGERAPGESGAAQPRRRARAGG